MSLFTYIKYSYINENSTIEDLYTLPTQLLYAWLHTQSGGDETFSTKNISKLHSMLYEYVEEDAE